MKNGIYTDISIEKYHHEIEAISASRLKKVRKSEISFLHKEEQERKSHFDFGNAFELALMDEANGTNEFAKFVAVAPTTTWTKAALASNPDLKNPAASKVYKDLKAAWESSNDGKYQINAEGPESLGTINGMLSMLKKDETVWKLLENTSYQLTAIWEDEGLKLKTRPDVAKINKNVILDVKTTRDASPHAFARQCAQLDYPIQAVMQIEGLEKSGGMEKVDRYYWLAVEKEAPYNYGLYHFTPDDIGAARIMYQDALRRVRDIDKDNPKSYGKEASNEFGILDLEIPNYYYEI